MIKIENIKKSFKDKVVLDGINLEVNAGEVYGLVGANGAGKTTLLNIVSRVLYQDEGQVKVLDKEIEISNELKGILGYITDIPSMFEYLTAWEYLKFISSPLNLSENEFKEKAESVLTEVNLMDAKDKRIKTFSRGMKQRMGIAAGLISNPVIVLMDEPCSALDPMGRHDVLNIINNLKTQGKTVILSTHILSDIEKVCDKVGFLVNGKIKVEGKLKDVLDKFSLPVYIVYADEKDLDKVVNTAKKSEYFVSCKKLNGTVEVEFLKEGKRKMFKTLSGANIDVKGIMLKEASIEQIFLKLSKED